jgi:hypothetical protein
MRNVLVLGLLFLLGSACTHAQAPVPMAPPEAAVEAGRLVRHGHAPLGAPTDASMVMLELELSSGDKLISQPSVITLPDTDAIVRQGLTLGVGEARTDATLDLTLRPVLTAGNRCTVQASTRLSSAAGVDSATRKQWRVAVGKWVDVLDEAPVQVRMRCTRAEAPPQLARAR